MRTDRLYTSAKRASVHNAPHRAVLFGTVAAVWAGEAGALLAIAAGYPIVALGCHAAAAALAAGVAVGTAQRDGVAASALRLLAITLPLFGPFAAFTATAVLLPRRQTRAEDDASLWHAHLFPTLAPDQLAEDIHALNRMTPDHGGSSTVSFRNVLQFGSLEQQEYVIALMSRMPRPNFAPLFQEALGSDQPGVRAQAAAGLSMLEARLNSKTTELRHALARTTDAGERDELLTSLAQHLGTVADSGMMDAMRTFGLRTEAVAIWQDLATRHHDSVSTRVGYGRELARLRQFGRATEELWAARAAGDESPAVLGLLCDCLFQTEQLDELRFVLQQGSMTPSEPTQLWLEAAS